MEEREFDYLSMLLESPFAEASPQAFIMLFIMGLFRLGPILAMTPFLGAKILPHPTKVAIGITLYVLFLPHILSTITTPPEEFQLNIFAHGLKELLIGTLIGLTSSLPFFMAETAGIYIDHQRGGSSLMLQDPHVQNQDSPFGILWNYILIVTFYALDGQFYYIEAIMHSYESIPVDKFFSPHFFSEESPFWVEIMTWLGTVVRIGVQLATPALLTILMTEVFLGIANRLAPQVMITFLGMPLKSLFALGIICFGWGFIVSQLKKELINWLHKIHEIVDYLAYGL